MSGGKCSSKSRERLSSVRKSRGLFGNTGNEIVNTKFFIYMVLRGSPRHSQLGVGLVKYCIFNVTAENAHERSLTAKACHDIAFTAYSLQYI